MGLGRQDFLLTGLSTVSVVKTCDKEVVFYRCRSSYFPTPRELACLHERSKADRFEKCLELTGLVVSATGGKQRLHKIFLYEDFVNFFQFFGLIMSLWF